MAHRSAHVNLSLEALRVCISQAGSDASELQSLRTELRRRVLHSRRALLVAEELLAELDARLTAPRPKHRVKRTASPAPSGTAAPSFTPTELRQLARHLKAVGFEGVSATSIGLLSHAKQTELRCWFDAERDRLRQYERPSKVSTPQRRSAAVAISHANIATTLAAEGPEFERLLGQYAKHSTDSLLSRWNGGHPKKTDGTALPARAKRALAIAIRQRLQNAE